MLLVPSPEFRPLLETTTYGGCPHVTASLRQENIEGILSSQLDLAHRGANGIVLEHQLSAARLGQVEKLKADRKLTLGAFYQQAPQYRIYVDQLQSLFVDAKRYRLYKNLPSDYRKHVESAVESILAMSNVPRIRTATKGVQARLLSQPLDQAIRRSDLWPELNRFKLNSVELDLLRKWLLILPYNRNIAESDGFDMSYSSGLTPHLVRTALGPEAYPQGRTWEIHPELVYEPKAIFEVDRLSFAQIAQIRQRHDFDETVKAFEACVEHGSAHEAKRAMHAHIKVLDQAISDHLGSSRRIKAPLAIEVLLDSAKEVLEYKFPLLKLVPACETLLSRITDRWALSVRSPRWKRLAMVGESIIESARREKPDN